MRTRQRSTGQHARLQCSLTSKCDKADATTHLALRRRARREPLLGSPRGARRAAAPRRSGLHVIDTRSTRGPIPRALIRPSQTAANPHAAHRHLTKPSRGLSPDEIAIGAASPLPRRMCMQYPVHSIPGHAIWPPHVIIDALPRRT